MLTKKQLDRYASVLLWGMKTARRNRYRRGDIVLIRFDRPALALAEVLYARLLEMGHHPVQRMNPSFTMEKSHLTLSDDKQLMFQPPGEIELFEALNGSITLHAPESVTHLSDVDPGRIGRAVLGKKPFRDIMERREATGRLGWTLCVFPTEALARNAGLTIDAYCRQIVKACFLDRREPVAHWREVHGEATRIKRWLDRMKVDRFHIESSRIDLEITPGEQRRWLGVSGRNIPSFEIFLSPDWRGTRGVFYADQPSYRSGNRVHRVRLEFANGIVTSASAETGETFLKKQMAMDPGAGRLGEFSLTDRRLSKIDRFMANTLFDENFGGKNGNCHVALGAAYATSFKGKPADLTRALKKRLGFNDSALHWDLVNTEKKRVTARLTSGRRVTIYEDGKFTC